MRLIDADALEDVLVNHGFYYCNESDYSDGVAWGFLLARDDVRETPTIDAEPIRHGKWILTNKPNIYGGTTIKCSVCGYEGVIAHIEDHHYCWVCGAKMEIENEDMEER